MNLSARQGLRLPKIFMMEGFTKSRGSRSIILLFTIFLCIIEGYYFNFVTRAKIDYADVYTAQ
ncbi:MAG: hypothetical protein KAU41_06575, partial [Deltaproteobacteria bacterium]|nr:hypothetical protein [Deltaproteobacteria bacterium]